MFVAFSVRPILACWTRICCTVVFRGLGIGKVGFERAMEQILAIVLLMASLRAQ